MNITPQAADAFARAWDETRDGPRENRPANPEQKSVVSIVPSDCTGSAFSFDPGVLYVNKDGSGYIAIDEDHFTLEDDRGEDWDGPSGSVHWITRLPHGEMTALRDFLNGIKFEPSPDYRALLEMAAEAQFDDYDAGMLNDFGGGNVDWWQDYLRAEIGRANDFWRHQIESTLTTIKTALDQTNDK